MKHVDRSTGQLAVSSLHCCQQMPSVYVMYLRRYCWSVQRLSCTSHLVVVYTSTDAHMVYAAAGILTRPGSNFFYRFEPALQAFHLIVVPRSALVEQL